MATDAVIDPFLLQQSASMPESAPKRTLDGGDLNARKKKKQKQ